MHGFAQRFVKHLRTPAPISQLPTRTPNLRRGGQRLCARPGRVSSEACLVAVCAIGSRRHFSHIEADSPRAAIHVDEQIDAAVRRLIEFPESGRPGRIAGTRELVVPRTPYIAAYVVVPGNGPYPAHAARGSDMAGIHRPNLASHLQEHAESQQNTTGCARIVRNCSPQR
jgi:toxin ParE1/3/4